MELTDIMPKEKWLELQEELHTRFQLNADVMDKEGKRMAGNTWGNALCKAIREDKKGLGAICIPAGSVFVQMMQDGEPFAEECDGGMARISVPVKVDGEVIGAVGGCGVILDDGEVDEFTIGMMSDLEESAIEEMVGEVPTATEEKVKEIQEFIQKRIEEALQ